MEIAERFVSQSAPVTRTATGIQKIWDSHDITDAGKRSCSADEGPTFHLFTINGQGFVIVAGEEVGNNIIGYSFNSPISDEIPAGMVDYLTTIDAQIRHKRANGATTRGAVTEATKLGNVVVDLNTARWGQNAPFNRLCFTSSGAQAKTGCVPTAFAIVMRHHKWPLSRLVKLYNPNTGIPVEPGHLYDWDNMPLDYSGTYTDEQATQVATVMQDLGYAYMVRYGTNSTDGNPNASKMQEYFNYTCKSNGTSSSGMFNRAFTGETQWVDLIKESLDNNCPIPYQATNSGSGSDAKHIFILDGYTDNGYFHFNWGWQGAYDGYFTLSNMDPTPTDQYAGTGTDNHNAIFNLRPNRGNVTITATANESGTGTATVNGESAVTVEAGNKVTLAATPAEGYLFAKWTLANEVISRDAETTVTATADAEYVAHFILAATAPDVTISVSSTEGGTATVEGTGSVTVAMGTEVTMAATANSGYIFVGWDVDGTVVSKNATYTTIANENRNYTAIFAVAENEKVTIKLYGSGGSKTIESDGNINYSGNLSVTKGSAVTLNTESEDNTFAFFTSGKSYKDGGVIVSNKRPYTFIATATTTFYINYVEFMNEGFDLNTTVTVTANTGGTATVDGSTTTKDVKLGDEITLKATADNGYKFAYWSVDEENVSIEPMFTTVVQEATEYTANFKTLIVITANATNGGTATVNGNTSISVEEGEEFTLTAIADEGYEFDNWSADGEVVSTEPVFTTTANGTTVYTANFKSTKEPVTEEVITINIYGSGTFCSAHALDFSNTSSLKAYVATGYNAQTQVVTLTRIHTSKPAIGLYLVGEPGQHVIPVIESSSDNTLNMLAGTLGDTVINSTSDDGTYANFKYTVTEENAVPMFYQFQDNTPLGANKAYLQIPIEWLEDAPAKSVSIRFDDVENSTSIGEELENTREDCIIYDLTGRRISNITVPNIYIINGKKTIIRQGNSHR